MYECAIVISNDIDLAEALKFVKQKNKKRIGLLTPWRYNPSKKLLNHADFNKIIRKGPLSQAQLPDPIPGTNLHKPEVW